MVCFTTPVLPKSNSEAEKISAFAEIKSLACCLLACLFHFLLIQEVEYQVDIANVLVPFLQLP